LGGDPPRRPGPYADWDWEATERHYRRAIELSPGNATARTWFALFLARMGREDEAVAQAAAGLDLDPLAHESSWMYLIVLGQLARHAEAVALGHKAAKLHPLSVHVHWPTAWPTSALANPTMASSGSGPVWSAIPPILMPVRTR
jgi:hypothetical protein